MEDQQIHREQPQLEESRKINNFYKTKRYHKEQIRVSLLQLITRTIDKYELTIVQWSQRLLGIKELHVKIFSQQLESLLERGRYRFILDTVRMDFDEDDNHYPNRDHDRNNNHNHQHDKERYDRNYQLDLLRGRKRRRQPALPPVQTVTGAPVYMSNLQIAKEEAFHMANNISPNLDEESSVNREVQIQQQDVIINNAQNEQSEQIDVINLEQNIQQDIVDTPRNEEGNTNNEAEQSIQTGTIHAPQTETPDNLQHQQNEQNDDLNIMEGQNPIQPTQIFSGLLTIVCKHVKIVNT
ncbi:MAG: hypothetical protein EZS28_039263 [Streblomastix strix]|uniref:Uncharacterized protein n=1 Tax=Streblomastix strix TaxID=222440 RepID=A0A5J4U5E4_9EUKA|nr:MAG: hypothetical protein EZS28_039263 [Streblomastix strix]